MVSSFWSMKIYDCVYLTAGIPNKLSLGSTLNKLVNFLDIYIFFSSKCWDETQQIVLHVNVVLSLSTKLQINRSAGQCKFPVAFNGPSTASHVGLQSEKGCRAVWSNCFRKATQGFSSNTDPELSYHSCLLIHWLHLDFPFFLYL